MLDDNFKKQFWSGANLINLQKKNQNNRNVKAPLAKIFEAGMIEFTKTNLSNNNAPKNSERAMKSMVDNEIKVLNKLPRILYLLISSSYYVGMLGVLYKSLGIAIPYMTSVTIDVFIDNILESILLIIITIIFTFPFEIAYKHINDMIYDYLREFNIFIKEFINILERQKNN
ncbi:hypothetical protein [Candidatus Kinetoplastidibacterium desouzai]|nr:hypothetical protein [Candidatus Kinetoplastibacterium desouzaii]